MLISHMSFWSGEDGEESGSELQQAEDEEKDEKREMANVEREAENYQKEVGILMIVFVDNIMWR